MSIRSVIICKISHYLPGDKARSCNRRHIWYIANKPEADRGDEQSLYVGDEKYRVEPDTAAGHVKYAAERPGSSGLFGPDAESPPDWREVARELAHHDLPTWRMIISLREDDAVKLDLTERRDWETAVRRAMEGVVRSMHLDLGRARWVAAYHATQGHPHVHIVVWESPHRAARRRGLLEPGERKGVWRAFARELLREERNRRVAEKAAIRDLVRDLAKGDVTRAAELVREVRGRARLEVQALMGGTPGIPPVLREHQLEELAEKLAALAAAMPGRGRAALAYMPEPVKAQARETADWLLRQPGFARSASRYTELARELASHYAKKPEILDQAAAKAYEDLRDRVAQVVVRAAAALNRAERREHLAREWDVPGEGAAPGGAGQSAEEALWRAAWRALGRETGAYGPVPEPAGNTLEALQARLAEVAQSLPDMPARPSLVFVPEEVQSAARDTAAWLLSQFPQGEAASEGLRERVAERVLVAAHDLRPREMPQVEMVLHPARAQNALARLREATADVVRGDTEEAEWTAKTMYRAMVHLGAGKEEARRVAVAWAKAAGLEGTEELIDRHAAWLQQADAPAWIGRAAWERLADNLGLEEEQFLRPWFGVKPQEEREQPARQGQDFPLPELVERRVSPAIEALREASRAPTDPDELRWTLWALPSVLRALGVGEEERRAIVAAWCRRAGVNLPEARLMDVLDRTELGDGRYWLGRAGWERLSQNLGLRRVESPWRVEEPLAKALARHTWRAAWRGVERERLRAEAQAQLASYREAARVEERAREERERQMGR